MSRAHGKTCNSHLQDEIRDNPANFLAGVPSARKLAYKEARESFEPFIWAALKNCEPHEDPLDLAECVIERNAKNPEFTRIITGDSLARRHRGSALTDDIVKQVQLALIIKVITKLTKKGKIVQTSSGHLERVA